MNYRLIALTILFSGTLTREELENMQQKYDAYVIYTMEQAMLQQLQAQQRANNQGNRPQNRPTTNTRR